VEKEVITLLLSTDGDRDQITSPLLHRKPGAAEKGRYWDFLETDALTTNSPSFPHCPHIFVLTANIKPPHAEKGNVSQWQTSVSGMLPQFSLGSGGGREEQRVALRGAGRGDAGWWAVSRAAGGGAVGQILPVP